MKDFKNFNGNANGEPPERKFSNEPHGEEKQADAQPRREEKQTGGKGADKSAYENTVNLAATLAKAFNGKSEGQIFQTILAQAEQGKREGTLTNADLDNFYAALSPLLDGFKRKKLQQIIGRLKSI
ncbi:MAG: hypothetical protein ACI4L9_02235 [Candidatus Coproplasma sp.]